MVESFFCAFDQVVAKSFIIFSHFGNLVVSKSFFIFVMDLILFLCFIIWRYYYWLISCTNIIFACFQFGSKIVNLVSVINFILARCVDCIYTSNLKAKVKMLLCP